MKDKKQIKLRSFSSGWEKEVDRFLEKIEHTAKKRLKKEEKQNPRWSFFYQNFLGKKISEFWTRRHFQEAETFYKQKNREKTDEMLKLTMSWNPFFVPAWLLKAEMALEDGQKMEAIWTATCALMLDPESIDALILRAQAELALENFASAVADWLQISERVPESAQANLNLGVIALHIGKFDLADYYIRLAHEQNPSLIHKMALVKNDIYSREFAEAEELGREVQKIFWKNLTTETSMPYKTREQRKALLEKIPGLEQIPSTKEFYFGLLTGLMFSLSSQLKFDEVREVCEEILYFWPENQEAKSCLAQTLVQKGEPDRALALFREILNLQPNSGTTNWFIGEILYKQKKWPEALPHLRIAIQKNVHLKEALHYTLVCMSELKSEEEIEKFCSEIIAQRKASAEIFHVRGSIYFALNRNDEALRDFQKASRLEPQNPECWLMLSRALLRERRLEESVEAAKRALKIQPGMIDAGLTLISVFDIQQRNKEALEAIEVLMKNVPNSVDYLILKGQFLSRQKKFQEAKEAYTEALKQMPNHPIARIGRAQIWQNEENWKNAYEDVSEAIKAAPGIMGFYLHRAQYAANLKDFTQALSDLRRYMAREPDDLRALMLLGEIRLDMKKPEAAIVLFQKILAKDPQCVLALVRSAEAKSTLNLQEPALADIERAIGIDSGDEELKILRVQLLLKLDRETEAMEYCTSVLSQNPESVPFHYNRGAILLNSHRPEEALPDFEWVCERDPEGVQPHFARALALNALFRHEEAMEALNRVLEIQPDFIPALSEKAMTHSILGNPELALQLLDKILEKTPEDVRLLNIRGTILANEQRVEDARDTFQKAVDIQPDYAPALNNLGHMQMMLGDFEQGIESLSLGIACNPQWGRPHLNRAHIYMRMHELADAENDISEAQRKAQNAGDEDVLVDAIELRKKLEILKKFLGSEIQDDLNSKLELWNGEDSDDSHEDFDLNSILDLEDDAEDSGFLKKLFESFNDEDEIAENEEDYLNLDDSDDEMDDESDDESMDELDDELDDEMENPDDFDFSIDSENEVANLTSDFMQVEEFLGDVVSKAPDIGKNLWPKIEKPNEKGTSSNLEESENYEENFSAEMMLNYIDLATEENSGKQNPPNPLQIQQAMDFLSGVFQFWDSEKLKARTSSLDEKKKVEEEDGKKEKGEFLPPIIINCPEILQMFPNDSLKQFGTNTSVSPDFLIPMASYIRYKTNREFFFEQLTAISELLEQTLQNAETPNQKRAAKYHKKEFGFLMELVMQNLINKENEILLVITNFLNTRLMNGLSGQ